jgi:class 3 adenylate cyclase
LNLTELLADLVARAGQLLDTPHGYIYLVEGSGGTLERSIGIGAYAKSIGYNLRPDQGLAGKVWQSGAPLVVNDYETWEGRVVDATYEVNIRALTGVPLKSGAEVIGVLGMAYDIQSDKSFGEDEVELLSRFAQLASISLDNARLYTAAQDAMKRTEEASKRVTEQNRILESISSQLSKYLSPQLYASIFSGEQTVEIASQRKKLTVFFSDIVDFTETTDSLESEELTQLLNHHLTEMSQIALEHGATIDKYVGDSIMVFFGDPETKGVKEDAVACVEMAIAMQRRMRELQSEWLDLGSEKPFQLRIGINTGYCTVGNFGSEERMDYTIIGNEVNLAARLQSHADVGGVLIAHETYALVKDLVHAQEQEPIAVKGFAKPVRTYRVAGIYGELADEGRIIHHDEEALKILVDLEKLSDQGRAEAIQTVENILAKMKK